MIQRHIKIVLGYKNIINSQLALNSSNIKAVNYKIRK